jgi:hypothetical protein
MRLARVLAVALAVGLPAQDRAAFAAAVADYRGQRFEAAFAAFQAAAAAAGDAASDELRWNLALAALRLQRSGDAEAAVLPWLRDASGGRRADGEFVVAMAQSQRAERSAAAAALPDAEPMAWAAAILQMERAVAGFERAAAMRGDWPAAVRNAERARAAVEELRRRQAAAAPPNVQQEPAPAEPPPPSPEPEPTPEVVAPELTQDRLSTAELARLRQRVAARDEQKRASRREELRQAVVQGTRAW